MGESAGGSSIMHQITAFRAKSPLPFSQAILQSPAFISKASNWQNELIFQKFLKHLNVSSLEEARNLPSEYLIKGNIAQVSAGEFVDFSYGPTVDGTFTPGIPQRLLSSGLFNNSVNVMVAHNSWEGGLFQSPYTANLSTLTDLIKVIVPSVSPGALSKITDGLYPPVFDGSRGFTTYGELQGQRMPPLFVAPLPLVGLLNTKPIPVRYLIYFYSILSSFPFMLSVIYPNLLN